MSSQLRSIPTADRISLLPDSILCHILSFLPTKLAATTSILSKRWNPVWLSTLTLHFDDQTFKDFNTFRCFVSSVLLSRDFNLPIRSFHLKCGNYFDCNPHDINRFVRAAIQRGGGGGIQNLELDLDIGTRQLSPTRFLSFLSCRTLVVLKLKNLVIYDIPPKVDLPLLKTLHLDMIFLMHDRSYFQDIFYGCPDLEDLHIHRVGVKVNCLFYDSNGKFKYLPKLVRANFSKTLNFPFAWVPNAKFLRADLRDPYEYQVPTFHNLIHMELIISIEIWPEKWNWVIEVLQHCPKLQNLIINEGSKNVEVTGDEDWKQPETVPECLSSQLKTCLLRNYKGLKCELQFAEYIMQNSTLMSTMTIKTSSSAYKNEKLKMLVKLSMCSRGSGTCKLLFD